MTGTLWLDWALGTVSLFNTIVLLWLGLTVLLNSDRRAWGIWLAGGGLLLGALFFVSHSAILWHSPTAPGHGASFAGRGMEFWWRVGWVPVLFLPFAWYTLMLWYAGFWDAGGKSGLRSPLRKRQRPWLVLASLLAVLLGGLVVFGGALPPFRQVAYLEWPASVPRWLLVVYPAYVVLCTSLSLDALLRPHPSGRWMGDLARRRARPWLLAASLVLLAVSLLIAGGMALVGLGWRSSPASVLALARLDLIAATLVAVATVCLGQAIVTYEVFTGKTLPRRGFRRYWYNALLLAAGYSAVVSGSLTIQLRPVYSLLSSTLLLVTFYALLIWRSFAEREAAMAQLRPFITGRPFTEGLLSRSPEPGAPVPDVEQPFHALCADVLGAQVAYLVPLGALAPLAGAGFVYPPGGHVPSAPASWLGTDVLARLKSTQSISVPLDSVQAGGAAWAVSLWSERGLIGALLLGPKRDGGPYTLEEMEVARAAGERLLETQAGVEMSRRLMALQRQRLAESQVIDGRTRRVVHDDVLPRLHTALLGLSSRLDPKDAEAREALALLSSVHRQLSDLLHEMPAAVAPQLSRLGLIGALREVAARELVETCDLVNWQVEPYAERQAANLPPLTAEVIFSAAREAIRNAARHARREDPATPLRLSVCVSGGRELTIAIEDDGIGLPGGGNGAEPEVRLAFVPGARPAGGAGQGLALHSTMMAVIGGTLDVESEPGLFTRVSLRLPLADGQIV